VTAFLPGAAEETKVLLQRNGVTMLDQPAELPTQLQRSRLVVHFGGHGIAAAALLAGVPQVILDIDIEKLLIATALARRGVAQRYDYFEVAPETLKAGILASLRDPFLAGEAKRAALEHDKYRDRDVASQIAATCERMVA
jgi:UDP:flavonoid glycosyltransferase YjiC (YdhE family)